MERDQNVNSKGFATKTVLEKEFCSLHQMQQSANIAACVNSSANSYLPRLPVLWFLRPDDSHSFGNVDANEKNNAYDTLY